MKLNHQNVFECLSMFVCVVWYAQLCFVRKRRDKVCNTFGRFAIDLPIDHHLPFVHVLSLAELECVSGCSCLKISNILSSLFYSHFRVCVHFLTYFLNDVICEEMSIQS